MKINKQQLIDTLKTTITHVQGKIDMELEKVKEMSNKPLKEIKAMRPEDQLVYGNLQAYSINRLAELHHLHSSPFFIKLVLKMSKTGEEKTLYFAKHHFTDEQIYSWVAPIAAVRFEKPGPVEYRLPDGTTEHATLNNKEQYLIVDGKIVFFATESTENPRELIYQEHFSSKKDGFILPEIVAVMEKAQDKVIRAHHSGPFVISGPAGSGKTTLALHRVAYLVQAPDTASLYPGESIIVFVQDNGTKDYFSHLLPELGINNVHITTFFEWATTILGVPNARHVDRRGVDKNDKNTKEFERLQQLKLKNVPTWAETKKLLKTYSETGLDRIDLTLALASYFNQHKKFEIKTKYTTVDKKGELVQKTRKKLLEYSLLVIDEFQNYMPEQLSLLHQCIDEKTRSIIYVGDMAQQVLSGTLRSWDSVGARLDPEREVRLHKVYRNTREILEYIEKLGYPVEIPEGIKSGPAVTEITLATEDAVRYIQDRIISTKGTVGIIGKNTEDIAPFKEIFATDKQVHVTTMAHSQGVEFDIVCLVGITKEMSSTEHLSTFPADFIDEKKKIQKDLLYVALTRAISELHIIGTSKLSDIVSK
ncbi:MAG: AAA family ATPase [bacterium]